MSFNPFMVLALQPSFDDLDTSLLLVQYIYHRDDPNYDKTSLWVQIYLCSCIACSDIFLWLSHLSILLSMDSVCTRICYRVISLVFLCVWLWWWVFSWVTIISVCGVWWLNWRSLLDWSKKESTISFPDSYMLLFNYYLTSYDIY